MGRAQGLCASAGMEDRRSRRAGVRGHGVIRPGLRGGAGGFPCRREKTPREFAPCWRLVCGIPGMGHAGRHWSTLCDGGVGRDTMRSRLAYPREALCECQRATLKGRPSRGSWVATDPRRPDRQTRKMSEAVKVTFRSRSASSFSPPLRLPFESNQSVSSDASKMNRSFLSWA